MRVYLFTIIYIIVIFLLTHKIVFVILSYCHNCHTKRLYAPGGDTLLLLAENPQSASGKIRFASCKR